MVFSSFKALYITDEARPRCNNVHLYNQQCNEDSTNLSLTKNLNYFWVGFASIYELTPSMCVVEVVRMCEDFMHYSRISVGKTSEINFSRQRRRHFILHFEKLRRLFIRNLFFRVLSFQNTPFLGREFQIPKLANPTKEINVWFLVAFISTFWGPCVYFSPFFFRMLILPAR